MFRFFLDSGQIPSIWNTAIIIPIYKKGDKTDPNNYRPISLTSTICWILEQILADEIIKFLNKKSFFSLDQFDFLKARATTTQLLTTLNDFYEAIENKEKIDVIYIDFAKAFDSVPIELLLQKFIKSEYVEKFINLFKTFI